MAFRSVSTGQTTFAPCLVTTRRQLYSCSWKTLCREFTHFSFRNSHCRRNARDFIAVLWLKEDVLYGHFTKSDPSLRIHSILAAGRVAPQRCGRCCSLQLQPATGWLRELHCRAIVGEHGAQLYTAPFAAREDVALELDTDTEVSRAIRPLGFGQGRAETIHKHVRPVDCRLRTFSVSVAFLSLALFQLQV